MKKYIIYLLKLIRILRIKARSFIYHNYISTKINYIIFKLKLKFNKKINIIIGAEDTHQKGFIKTQEDYLNLLNINHWKIFQNKKINIILAEHVFKHLTKKEFIVTLNIIKKYLKENGRIRFAVPDRNFPNEKYHEKNKPSNLPGGHKVFYTYQDIQKIGVANGFKVKLLEYTNTNGKYILNSWDDEYGIIRRSYKYDKRNKQGEINYLSLIVDYIN